jgi:KDO2-lipid IV(A) lauroyltransferase
MARKPRLADRLEYAAFASVMAAANRVSEARAERMGEALGRFGYRRLGIRRDLVEEHLRRAFPERSEEWVRLTAEASYAHLGREIMTTLRLSHLSCDQVVRRVHHDLGRDRFYAAFAEGRGLVLAGAHIGNWELGGASIAAQGYPVDAVYQPLRNPIFNDAIVRARHRLGLQLIPRGVASKEALQRLRAGRIVAFISDQNAGRTGVFVPFFGRLASTHRGAALLAVRAGAPLFFGAAVRQADGYLGISEEITASRDGPLEEVVARLTAAFTAVLERLVRQSPEQYFWHHRRWKTRPHGEKRN